MRKMYLSAPLPFVGQKRMLAKEFMKVLEQAPDCCLTLPNPSSPTLLLSIMTLITTASA